MSEENDDRLCSIHRPLFNRIFERRRGETKWTLTPYAKRVSREGRLPVAGGVAVTRRSHRGGGARRSRAAFVTAAATSSLCQDARDELFDVSMAVEIDRANRDPLRDVLVFAATNHRLFTVGCERSVASVYRALWHLVYGSPKFAQRCICTNEVEYGARTVHVVHKAATFPWRAQGDTVVRFAYNGAHSSGHNDTSSSTVTIHARVSVNAADHSIEIARLRAHPYDETFIQRMHSVASEWWCDISLAWPRESRHDLGLAVKLMDNRFEDARQAWTLVFDVMDWCERTHHILSVYPVRRSVWDLLILPAAGGDNATNDHAAAHDARWCERVVSGCGLVDVGDICAYAYSLRVLMLIIYLGCSYGGMSRAAAANDRVSNRFHRCVFPKRTSGLYYALFHTSILPHRIFCCYRDDAAATPASVVSDDDRRSGAVCEATRWLERFEVICANAAERYKLPRRSSFDAAVVAAAAEDV